MKGYFGLGQMSTNEKSNILDQHRQVYNGYRTMQPEVSNTQPLYVQDFAGDKNGITINNKGEIKHYTNVGINEQVEKSKVCNECGGMMYENVCEDCGSTYMEEGKKPETEKEKKFAALAEPEDEITYADKIAGATKNKKKKGDEVEESAKDLAESVTKTFNPSFLTENMDNFNKLINYRNK
jgi:hypothetical protein